MEYGRVLVLINVSPVPSSAEAPSRTKDSATWNNWTSARELASVVNRVKTDIGMASCELLIEVGL